MLATGGAVALLPAALLVADGMGDLRVAYLSREGGGDGIGLAWVAFRLFAGGVAALVGIAALVTASAFTSRRTGMVLRGAAAAALVALAGCAAVAVWVALQSGCIGPCG